MRNLLICVLTVAGSGAWAQSSLSLSGGSGAPGSKVAVAINFAGNGAGATAIQWTLNYSAADFSSVAVAASASATAAGDVLSCRPIVPGQVNCLMIDIASSTVLVPDGQIAVATFAISASTTHTSSAILLSDLAASTGNPPMGVSLTGTGTTITITQSGGGGGGGLNFAGSMAHLASGGSWDTTLTLVNTGAAPSEALLNFFGGDGSPLQLPFTFPQASATSPLVASTLDQTINADSLLVVDTQEPGTNLQVGSAQLLTGNNIGGFAIFKYGVTGQEAVVPLETRDAASYVLAFDNTGAVATGVALTNVATQSANVQVVIFDDTGAEIGTDSIALAAQGHTSFLLAKKYAFSQGKRGTVEFLTPLGGQISALGLRANGKALTTLPLLTSATAGNGSMAHVASGGGWETTFTLVNTGASPAAVTMSFSDDSGKALSLPLSLVQTGKVITTATLQQTIAAGATLVIVTQAGTKLVVVGSAQLITGGDVSGFAIFRYNTTGQEAVVPLETRNASAYVLAFDNTNGLKTGVALANVSVPSQMVAVQVVLRDDTGASLGTATINLPAGGHTSFILADSYGAVAGKRGTVEFDIPPGPAGTQISALGLRATPAGAVTTIPVLAK